MSAAHRPHAPRARHLALASLASLASLALACQGAQSGDRESARSEAAAPTGVVAPSGAPAPTAPPPPPAIAAAPAESAAMGGEAGGGPSSGAAKPADAAPPAMKMKKEMAREAEAMDEEIAAPDPAKPRPDFDRNVQAGLLTAGAFDDLKNPTVLERFLAEFAQRSDFGQLVGAFTGARMVVTVQDEKARPLGDAEVTFTDAKGTVRTLRSRSDGKVVHVSPHDGDAPVKVSVRHGSAAVERAFKDPVAESLIFLPGASAALPSSLDLLLVIDATGSMSDEIEYLKVELRSIAQSIAEAHPQVDQRYGLVVYRDRGDDYLTRRFDFTSSLEDFIKTLGEQSAGGGGDYPEAMEAALADAEGLSWRKGNVARVSFLIADAPPHIEHYGATLGSVERLREKGVVIYPIAASGAASEAEIFMRIAAMLTGAVYIFLTDDSGVGNSHAEPHIPCYFVERLSGVMSRVLQDELAGTRSDPDPSRVIRTVGAPKGGVCTRQ